MSRKLQYYCDRCGELINLDKEHRFIYNRKSYHYDCLLDKLKRQRKPKLSPDEIQDIVKKAEHIEKVTTKKNPTRVKVPVLNKDIHDISQQDKDKLIKYVEPRYRFVFAFSKPANNAVDSMNMGRYKNLNGKRIPYRLIYEMLCYYDKELEYAHSRLKTEITGVNLFLYDLAILVNKVQEYGYVKARQNLDQYQYDSKKQEELKNDSVDILSYTKNRVNEDNIDNMDSVDFWDDYE